MRIADATVVVTGGRGFLGRHVTEELERHGAKAIPLGTADYDLRRRAEVERMLADTSPDAVVHLAAVVGGIGANRAQPGRVLLRERRHGHPAARGMPGRQRLQGGRRGHGLRVSQDAPVPFQETDLWDGYPEETNAPYGLAKKMLLVQAQAYRDQYGFNVVYVIPVNLYGPNDNFDLETCHVIPAMIRKFVEAKDGGRGGWSCGATAARPESSSMFATRPGRSGSPSSATTAGSPSTWGPRRRSRSAISPTCRLRNRVPRRDPLGPQQAQRQPRRLLATDRARALLGFEATVTLRDGIPEVVDWYRRHAGAI